MPSAPKLSAAWFFCSLVPIGNSFNFVGGTGEFVGIPNHPWGTTAFTALVWYLPTNLNGDPLADWTNGGVSPQTFLIRADGTNVETFVHSGAVQVGGEAAFPTQSLSTKEFNHVVMTYDGQRMRTYLNGELSTTVYDFGSPSVIGNGSSADIAAIGGRGSSEGDMVGLIDDVAFWNETLTDGMVAGAYNLATEPTLNYDANQANQLFDLFLGDVDEVQIDGLTWVRASGISGSAGDVVDLGGGNFSVNLFGTAGVSMLVPEPATFVLWLAVAMGLAAFRHRRK